MAKLANGKNIIIQQKVGDQSTPIYPFTKVANVVDADGNGLDTVIAGINAKNYVPDYASETVSDLRFLRNDNTWATIQSASTEQAGVVQLSEATDSTSATTAATSSAVKAVKDAVDALSKGSASAYVQKTQLGVASKEADESAGTAAVTGVATLDTAGKIPVAQLPSYVSDVFEVKMAADLKSATDAKGVVVTPAADKIYVDAIGAEGAPATNKTYRWSGSTYVEISESLALGETANTAFDGARGLIAYNYAVAEHARVDATKVEASETNGNIKINGVETQVYKLPDDIKTTLGIDKVENKTAAEILDEITKDIIVAKLGYTPQDASVKATSSQDGVMTKEYAAKLDNCQEIAVSDSTPSFASGNGIWFQVVSTDAATA